MKGSVKKFFGVMIIILLLSGMSLFSFAESDAYTVLIYLNGSDLESAYDEFENRLLGNATSDLNEMIKGYNGSDKVNVIVQTGGTLKWANDFVDEGQSQRFELVNGNFQLIESMPKQNFGYKKTLSDFIVWGTKNYPADKTALFMWNHGAGPVGGYGSDELFEHDSLQLEELEAALKTAYETSGVKFELLGFDACLMASLEVVDTIKDYAHYFVGSQELEPGHGWDYTAIVQYLVENNSASGKDLGIKIADSFYKHALENDTAYDITLSVIDLSKIDPVVGAFENLVTDAKARMSDDVFFYEFSRSALTAKSFGGNTEIQGYTDLIDLKDFSKYLELNQKDQTDLLSKAIDEAVLYRVEGDFVSDTCGLSIYFPYRDKAYYTDNMALYTRTKFSETYMTFLKDFRARLIELMGDGEIKFTLNEASEDNPYYELVFDEDEMKKVYYMYIDLYAEANNPEEEGYAYKYLGTDFLVRYDEERKSYFDDFDFSWTLFGGQPLATYVVAEYQDLVEYEAPVLYNGVNMNMLFAWVNEYEEGVSGGEPVGGHYEIYGLRRGIDEETGMPDKNIYHLKAGDVLTPLYDGFTSDERDVVVEGSPITITGEEELVFDTLDSTSFLLAFRFIDFSYQVHHTDFYPVYRAD
jgi:hypothetical protein